MFQAPGGGVGGSTGREGTGAGKLSAAGFRFFLSSSSSSSIIACLRRLRMKSTALVVS
jgi:hypothetical protein